MKIIICTTFRDFNGSENDKIQMRFIESIKKQTFSDYIVAVTTFGEKKVPGVLKSNFGDKCIIKDKKLEGYKFSLTDVVETAMEVAEEIAENSIIVWCTCDLVLQSNLFEELEKNYKTGVAGLIHPNIIYKDTEALAGNDGKIGSFQQGIDILFFDSKLLNGSAKKDIQEYRFYNWGVFEVFLVAIALKRSVNRINLFPVTKVKKIENDRAANNETDEYLQRCLNLNFPTLDRYVDDMGLKWNFVRDIYECHKAYRPVKYTKEYISLLIKFLFTKRLPRKIKLIGLWLFKRESYNKFVVRKGK